MIIEYKEINELTQEEITTIFELDDSKYADYLMFKNTPILKSFLEHLKQNGFISQIGDSIVVSII